MERGNQMKRIPIYVDKYTTSNYYYVIGLVSDRQTRIQIVYFN